MEQAKLILKEKLRHAALMLHVNHLAPTKNLTEDG